MPDIKIQENENIKNNSNRRTDCPKKSVHEFLGQLLRDTVQTKRESIMPKNDNTLELSSQYSINSDEFHINIDGTRGNILIPDIELDDNLNDYSITSMNTRKQRSSVFKMVAPKNFDEESNGKSPDEIGPIDNIKGHSSIKTSTIRRTSIITTQMHDYDNNIEPEFDLKEEDQMNPQQRARRESKHKKNSSRQSVSKRDNEKENISETRYNIENIEPEIYLNEEEKMNYQRRPSRKESKEKKNSSRQSVSKRDNEKENISEARNNIENIEPEINLKEEDKMNSQRRPRKESKEKKNSSRQSVSKKDNEKENISEARYNIENIEPEINLKEEDEMNSQRRPSREESKEKKNSNRQSVSKRVIEKENISEAKYNIANIEPENDLNEEDQTNSKKRASRREGKQKKNSTRQSVSKIDIEKEDIPEYKDKIAYNLVSDVPIDNAKRKSVTRSNTRNISSTVTSKIEDDYEHESDDELFKKGQSQRRNSKEENEQYTERPNFNSLQSEDHNKMSTKYMVGQEGSNHYSFDEGKLQRPRSHSKKDEELMSKSSPDNVKTHSVRRISTITRTSTVTTVIDEDDDSTGSNINLLQNDELKTSKINSKATNDRKDFSKIISVKSLDQITFDQDKIPHFKIHSKPSTKDSNEPNSFASNVDDVTRKRKISSVDKKTTSEHEILGNLLNEKVKDKRKIEDTATGHPHLHIISTSFEKEKDQNKTAPNIQKLESLSSTEFIKRDKKVSCISNKRQSVHEFLGRVLAESVRAKRESEISSNFDEDDMSSQSIYKNEMNFPKSDKYIEVDKDTFNDNGKSDEKTRIKSIKTIEVTELNVDLLNKDKDDDISNNITPENIDKQENKIINDEDEIEHQDPNLIYLPDEVNVRDFFSKPDEDLLEVTKPDKDSFEDVQDDAENGNDSIEELKEDTKPYQDSVEDVEEDMKINQDTVEDLNEDMKIDKGSVEDVNEDMIQDQDSVEDVMEDIKQGQGLLENMKEDMKQNQDSIEDFKERLSIPDSKINKMEENMTNDLIQDSALDKSEFNNLESIIIPSVKIIERNDESEVFIDLPPTFPESHCSIDSKLESLKHNDKDEISDFYLLVSDEPKIQITSDKEELGSILSVEELRISLNRNLEPEYKRDLIENPLIVKEISENDGNKSSVISSLNERYPEKENLKNNERASISEKILDIVGDLTETLTLISNKNLTDYHPSSYNQNESKDQVFLNSIDNTDSLPNIYRSYLADIQTLNLDNSENKSIDFDSDKGIKVKKPKTSETLNLYKKTLNCIPFQCVLDYVLDELANQKKINNESCEIDNNDYAHCLCCMNSDKSIISCSSACSGLTSKSFLGKHICSRNINIDIFRNICPQHESQIICNTKRDEFTETSYSGNNYKRDKETTTNIIDNRELLLNFCQVYVQQNKLLQTCKHVSLPRTQDCKSLNDSFPCTFHYRDCKVPITFSEGLHIPSCYNTRHLIEKSLQRNRNIPIVFSDSGTTKFNSCLDNVSSVLTPTYKYYQALNGRNSLH